MTPTEDQLRRQRELAARPLTPEQSLIAARDFIRTRNLPLGPEPPADRTPDDCRHRGAALFAGPFAHTARRQAHAHGRFDSCALGQQPATTVVRRPLVTAAGTVIEIVHIYDNVIVLDHRPQ